MESRELPKSVMAFKVRLTFIAVVSIIVAILAALVFGALFKLALGGYNGTRALTFLAVLFLAGVAAMIYYGRWQANTYELRSEGIVVNTGFGNFSRKQKLYLYESIISVSFNQDYFGKKYGYGNVHVTIPKLEQKLILEDIERPDQTMPALKMHIKDRDGASKVLVT